MHLIGISAGSSDVDHGVESGQEELGCVGAALRVGGRKGAGGDGMSPYLIQEAFGIDGGLDRLRAFGDFVESMGADRGVLAEGLAESGLRCGRRRSRRR
jgi:hypothetical protein